jgi:hypothetical protein
MRLPWNDSNPSMRIQLPTLPVLVLLVATFATGVATADDSIGPGPAHTVLVQKGYRIEIWVRPNIGARIPSTFTLDCTRSGAPVVGTVTARFTMPTMPMPLLSLRLDPKQAGLYRGTGVMLIMPGRWRIQFEIRPRGAPPLHVFVTDDAVLDTPD